MVWRAIVFGTYALHLVHLTTIGQLRSFEITMTYFTINFDSKALGHQK